ncbi:GntR family transcriptional regulator [Parenemella sanctibonifatiensis]|uniref:GntR family transcriptional regulator n=1 Tax=Parenemella sanctibonifatiensis TaxID=2016505 RepID=A0A255ELV4_9ACTN|nr:GntR family transcriptional regulator [Parenemella sanctibonifatiensis]
MREDPARLAVLSDAGVSGRQGRTPLSERVARRLEGRIVGGDHPVGSKLPSETVLAAEYGVGRSSMREAIRILATEGYLRPQHGRGVFVISTRPTVGGVDLALTGGYTVTDLFEARIAIEGAAAELAAKRRTDHHCEFLESILSAAANPNTSTEDFISLDGQFHHEIAQASGNPLLVRIWESIADQFTEYSRKVIGLEGRRERAHADHVAIARAVIEGDRDAARARAVDHVVAVQQELTRLRQ